LRQRLPLRGVAFQDDVEDLGRLCEGVFLAIPYDHSLGNIMEKQENGTFLSRDHSNRIAGHERPPSGYRTKAGEQ
jgi:hypothetical protein